jgi:hypothetical protein
MAASAFHPPPLSGLPPIGDLTTENRMMISGYTIFLYNLSAVCIMKLVDAKKFNSKTLKVLAALIAVLIIIQVIYKQP